MVHLKLEYHLSRKTYNYEISGILWKIKEMMQHVLKCSKFPCFLNIQNEFLGFVFADAGRITVKMGAIHTAQ
jgi:hypothetical protein